MSVFYPNVGLNQWAAVHCTRLLLFEEDSPDGQTWIGGTCFFRRTLRGHYVVTAKHCLKEVESRIVDVQQVKVQIEHGSRQVVPTRQALLCDTGNDRNASLGDLALLEIDEEVLGTEGVRSLHALNFSMVLDMDSCLQASKSSLLICVYPWEKSNVDYDRGTITRTTIFLDAVFDGPAEDAFCYKLRFKQETSLKSFNGFSGSPVFFAHQGWPTVEYHFAGALTQGSIDSGVGRFIGCIALFSRLGKNFCVKD